MLAPHTAMKLKPRKRNVLRDFLHMSGPLGVTHILAFNQSKDFTNLRIGRTPRGPTCTFRVDEYALAKDVARSQLRPKSPGDQFKTPPLLVLNNFGGEDVASTLLTKTFQNMLPSINVSTVELKHIRRVLLVHREPDASIHIRHYEITVKPTGLSKGVKAVIRTEVPDLGRYDDIADFILRGGEGYESDASDFGDNKVMLPQTMRGVGNKASQQSAIRLTEMGPRLKLDLLKIEAGFCDGEVLWHKYVTLTPEGRERAAKQRERKEQQRATRRAQQEQNVKRKKEERERAKKRARMHGGPVDPDAAQLSDDDDAEYFREEVGHEPEPELFRGGGRGGGGGRRGEKRRHA